MKIGTVLREYRQPAPPSCPDALSLIKSAGWVVDFQPGQFLYRGEWATIVRRLQDLLVRRALDLGYEEWLFPRLLPSQAIDSFELSQYKPDLLMRAGNEQERVLDPVQCVSLYYAYRGTCLPSHELPLRAVETLGGWTWRNEVPERLEGPYRAVEFNRVEVVFIGTPLQVEQCRSDIRDMYLSVLTSLGLSWQLVVGAGCMEIPALEDARDDAMCESDVPVQDIEVRVRGALSRDERPGGFERQSHEVLTSDGLTVRQNDSFYLDTDEICGCTVEGTHLVDQFGIRGPEGSQLWSGCCGIGLNRLVLALMYQHGVDICRWPEDVRELLAIPELEHGGVELPAAS